MEPTSQDLFFFQLTSGCDRIICKNPYCASCPKFIFSKKPPEELLHLASILSINQPDQLCPSPFTDPNFLSQKEVCDVFISKVISKKIEEDEIEVCLDLMFSTTFSLLFTSNSSISIRNPSVDEDKLKAFIISFSSDVANKTKLIQMLIKMVSSLKAVAPTFSWLRSFVMIFAFPQISSQHLFHSVLLPLIYMISNLPQELKSVFNKWVSTLNFIRNEMIEACKSAVNYKFSLEKNPEASVIFKILSALKIIKLSNSISEKPISSSMFYIQHLEDIIDSSSEIEYFNQNPDNSMLNYPFVLSLTKKSDICRIQSEDLMTQIGIDAFFNSCLSGKSEIEQMFFKLTVRRSDLIKDTLRQINKNKGLNLLKRLKVEFEGEPAIDSGGPSREFIFLISSQLFSPDYHMFKVVNHRLWFSDFTFEIDDSYFLVGAIVGLAIHNQIMMPVRFSLIIYKKLLKQNNFNLKDLAEVEPDTSSSLLKMIEMKNRGEDVSTLDLTFEVVVDNFGQKISMPIIQGYEGVVSNENLDFYIECLIKFKLIDFVQRQFASFQRGFSSVCQVSMYYSLDPEELDIFASGEEIFDWPELKRTTIYKNGYNIKSETIKLFWQVFDDLSQAEKRKFLFFVNGTDRAPLGGFGSLNLIIQREGRIDQLPVSHTCICTLCLPPYNSKSLLQSKLQIAIENSEGFGSK